MDIISALAVSIGLLAGVATWLFLGPMGGLGLSLWAAFVAWATFYHCGGKEAGLQKTIVHNIFGAFLGWLALLAISQISARHNIRCSVVGSHLRRDFGVCSGDRREERHVQRHPGCGVRLRQYCSARPCRRQAQRRHLGVARKSIHQYRHFDGDRSIVWLRFGEIRRCNLAESVARSDGAGLDHRMSEPRGAQLSGHLGAFWPSAR